MLFLPKGTLPPKMSGAGYARGSGASGHWLRARAAVVNTNTDGMSRWRHLFNVAKVNFKATQPGGRNTAPVLGITPYEAWFYQFATYIGIVLPGLFEGGIQLMQTLVGCSSVEAYEVMVSTTLAQMNQVTPIAPPITTVKATASMGGGPAIAGTATLSVATGANVQVGPISAVFSAALTISGFSVPTPPTPSGDPWYTAGTQITQFAMLPNSVAPGSLMLPWALLANIKPGTYVFTVTGLPTGVICSLDGIPLPGTLWLGWPMAGLFSVTASPDAPPGTYEATMQSTGPSGTNTFNFAVTILDPTAYTTALDFSGLPTNVTAAILGYAAYPLTGPFPATLEGLPNGTNTTFALSYNPSANTLTGELVFLVTIDPSTPTGTYTFSAALTGFGSAPAVSPQFTVTTIAQTPGQPCPPYQVATTVAAHTVCDGDWNVIGFSIFPTYPSEFNDPSQPAGYSLASCWTVSASPAYTSGYSAPSASSYAHILTTGPNLPSAAQVLAAWEDTFGPLPSAGKIKIIFQWVDPLSGAPGPQNIKTLSWQTGTNKGVQKPQGGWPGPTFDVSNTTPLIIAPGDTSVTFTVDQGYNYTGTITFSVKPASYIGTGTPPGKDALPTGLTATFDNPVFVFTNGVPDHTTMTLTLTAIAGSQQFNGAIDVEATDTVVTFGTYLTLSIVGVVTPQPPTNYLSMYPVTTEIYTPLSSTTALAFDLFNSGPEDMPVSMLTTNTDPDYTIEFGQGGPAAASWSPTFSPTPGFASPAVPSSTTYGAQTITVPNGAVAIGPGTDLTIPITTSPGGLPVYYVEVTPSVAHVTYGVVPGFGGDITGVNIDVDVSAVPGTYTLSLQLMDQYDTHLGGPLTVELTISTPTGGETTFALATGTALDALVGQTLTSAGYAPAGYNGKDAAIISSTDTTVTISQPTDPGTMTAEGIAGIINNGLTVPAGTLANPGLASVLAFVEVGTMYTMPTPQIQVVASAGKNTTYSIIGTDSNPSNGFQMSPLITYVNQPVPGTSTVTLEFNNTNPAAITATLSSVPPNGNGISVSVPASVTIPAAVGAVPGTTSITATITATAEADTSENWPAVQAIAGSYSQVVSIVFTDTQYGPLYMSLSPVNLNPTNGNSQSATLTVNNASAASATVALTPSYIPSGFTITVTPSTVTAPAGSTSSPGTATATVTVSVASGSPITTGQLNVNGAASGWSEITVPICLPYTT